MQVKIAIIGAGSMGSLYGAMLSQNEENEVFLIDVWKEHIDKINERGLLVHEGEKVLKYEKVKGLLDSKKAGVCDLVVVFVKSTLTESAVRENIDLFDENTSVITLQNGLGNVDIIGEEAGFEKVLGGTTAHGAYMMGPGEICHAGFGKTVIGELNGEASERIISISDNFIKSGLETVISNNILGLIWDKLIVNIGINPLTAITGLENGKLLEYPELLSIMEKAVNEAVMVSEKKGIKLSQEDPFSYVKEVASKTAHNKSSMLQDIENKRKTEIDMINGALVKEAEYLGIDVPINEMLTKLIKFLEKRKYE